MLKARVITALVMLAILLPVLFIMPIEALKVLLLLVIGAASWEWARLLWPQKPYVAIQYSALMVLVLIILWYVDANRLASNVIALLQLALIFLAFLFWVLIVPRIMKSGLDFSLQKWRSFLGIVGFCIFPACWFSLLILREMGLLVLLSALVWVWAADVGAYFVGKKFGRKKLAPALSPGKTIEGFLGGMLLVLLLACLGAIYTDLGMNYFSWLREQLGWLGLISIALAGGFFSVMGDLFESQLKRLAGVKDSSNLLPGHGGFLDRIDALLPVLPFAALIVLCLH
jgi:phosphatidate cytidylyltransferase